VIFDTCRSWTARLPAMVRLARVARVLFFGFAERLILVDYELLASRPAEVLQLIYDFIGEPPFNHD
jgi:hypothetical protein